VRDADQELLPPGRAWSHRRRSRTGIWTLILSLALHVGLLFLSTGWLDTRAIETEAPFVVSLVPPGQDAVATAESVTGPPAAAITAPVEAAEPPAAAEPEAAGEPEATVVELPPEPEVEPERVREPAAGESLAPQPGTVGRVRRDVAGELTAQLLTQLDTLPELPRAVDAPAARPSTPAAGERTGAMAGIEGPLGERGLVYLEDPPYPAWARSAGIEAEIRFRFWVSPAGHVTRIRALRKSGHPGFEPLARESLARWRFDPLPPGHERTEYGDVRIVWGFPTAGGTVDEGQP